MRPSRCWGRSLRRTLPTIAVDTRRGAIERINMPRRLARDEEYLRRRERELAGSPRRERGFHDRGWRQNFIWPARADQGGRIAAKSIARGLPPSFMRRIAAGAGTRSAPADGIVAGRSQRPQPGRQSGISANALPQHAFLTVVSRGREGQIVPRGRGSARRRYRTSDRTALHGLKWKMPDRYTGVVGPRL